jgi:hypothetical protein
MLLPGGTVKNAIENISTFLINMTNNATTNYWCNFCLLHSFTIGKSLLHKYRKCIFSNLLKKSNIFIQNVLLTTNCLGNKKCSEYIPKLEHLLISYHGIIVAYFPKPFHHKKTSELYIKWG